MHIKQRNTQSGDQNPESTWKVWDKYLEIKEQVYRCQIQGKYIIARFQQQELAVDILIFLKAKLVDITMTHGIPKYQHNYVRGPQN